MQGNPTSLIPLDVGFLVSCGACALSEAGRDVLWLRQLLGELGMPLANPTRLMEDNNPAIKWTEDSHAWSRSRHIDCSFHAIR